MCVLLQHHVPTLTRGMTVALTADHSTRTLTLTLTRTLWGGQRLVAVALTADHPSRTLALAQPERSGVTSAWILWLVKALLIV